MTALPESEERLRALRLEYAMKRAPSAVRDLLAEIERLRASLAEAEQDSKRWRALMGCERIRVLGSATTGYPEGRGHIGFDLWGAYDADGFDDSGSRKWLTEYADGLVRAALHTAEDPK